MIRLIDVVLIVLFGMLMISSIDEQIKVRLVGTENLAEMESNPQGYVMVGVSDTGQFLLEYGKREYSHTDRSEIRENIISEYKRLKDNYESGITDVEPQVRIWADSLARSADIQVVIDICKELNYPSGILTRIVYGAG